MHGKKVIYSPLDRYIICRFDIQNISYSVVSVYMPTSDNERLQLEIINELAEVLEGVMDSNIILAGDFNVVMNENLDRTGYKTGQDKIPNTRFTTLATGT